MDKTRFIYFLKCSGLFAGAVYVIAACVVIFAIMLDFMGVKEAFNLPDTFTLEERRIALAAISPVFFYLIYFVMTLRNDSHESTDLHDETAYVETLEKELAKHVGEQGVENIHREFEHK